MLLRPSAQRATSDSVLPQRAPSPLRRIGVRVAAVLTACGSLLVVAGGCDGFNAAKGAVDTTNASVQSTKATGDAVKGTGDALKGEVDKARGKKDDKGGGGGGEKKEDDDDTRIKAIKTSLDQPVNDQLKVADNDIVDWKSWDLSNIRARSWVVFELNWDEPSAELNLDVYDQVGQQVVQVPLTVEGTAPAAVKLTVDDKAPKTIDGYTVALDTGGPVKTGGETHLAFTISKDGKPVTTVRQGDELTVRVRFRSLAKRDYWDGVVVDVLPGGFEPILDDPVRPAAGGRWSPDYVDVREDLVAYVRRMGAA